MTFEEASGYLDSLARRKWHDGLGRMKALLELLNLQGFACGEERPAYIHVAGTNGKGSVTGMVQSLLMAMEVPVGAAASPYVYDVRERVQFNGSLITEEAFARLATRLRETDEILVKTEFGEASAFELKTALGFLYWKEQGVKAVALEVGLGGRIDATNVVEPASCVITSIGWDHMDVLGDTLPKIAWEKAGIIKPGRPIVCGSLPQEALEVVQDTASRVGAPLWRLGHEVTLGVGEDGYIVETPSSRWTGIIPSMFGDIQADNAAISLAAVELAGFHATEDQAREGILSARWPGRFEEKSWNGIPVILDGAHNRSAAENLAANLRQRFPWGRIGLVIGMLKGHHPAEFLPSFEGMDKSVAFVPSPGPRGRSAADVAAEAGMADRALPSISQAVMALVEEGCRAVCVCGSFYILKEAKDFVTS